MSLLSGLFGNLFGEHEAVRSARDNIEGEVSDAFYKYDRPADTFYVGVIVDGERVALYTYDTEGDADAAAGALSRFYRCSIRG